MHKRHGLVHQFGTRSGVEGPLRDVLIVLRSEEEALTTAGAQYVTVGKRRVRKPVA